MIDIHTVISTFADPAGVVVVHVGEAPRTKGRVGLPSVALVAVADAAHHPGAGGERNVRSGGDAYLATVERRTFYFQTEVLPVVVEPDAVDAWWIVAGGKRYRVDSVEAWTDGGFWVVETTRLQQDRSVVPVWFGMGPSVTFAAAAPIAYSPSRSFRFRLAGDPLPSSVFAVWPSLADGPSDVVAFRAINAAGVTVVVAATSVLTVVVGGIGYVTALLPWVAAADGSLHYEVT